MNTKENTDFARILDFLDNVIGERRHCCIGNCCRHCNMTAKKALALARKAGVRFEKAPDWLVLFAQLCITQGMEQAAEICQQRSRELLSDQHLAPRSAAGKQTAIAMGNEAANCAAVIRSRV